MSATVAGKVSRTERSYTTTTDSTYWAQVSEWPRCVASGGSLAEVMDGLTEAIAMYVTPEDEPLPVLKFRIAAVDLEVGSERPINPARRPLGSGPMRTPARTKSPHREWGFGRFDRRGDTPDISRYVYRA